MRLFLFISTLALTLCIMNTKAYACICAMSEDERVNKINSAIFIGVFKVLESEPAEFKSKDVPIMKGAIATETEQGVGYRIKSLSAYRGAFSETQTVYVNHNNGCNPSLMRKDGIYRAAIIRNNYGVNIFSSNCLTIKQEEWDDFQQSASMDDELKEFLNNCDKQNKTIRTIDRQMVCSGRAADHKKVCKDNAECEGFCVANDEDSMKDFMNSIKPDRPTTPATGECSEWTDYPGKSVIENGYIKIYNQKNEAKD